MPSESGKKRRSGSKNAAEEIKRLNRVLTAHSHSAQAMLRATDETAFMRDVCNIIVTDCGYAMVWIGFAEWDDNKSVRPVASAGFTDGYLETLQLSWANTERGRGPTGTAIRTGKPAGCQDMQSDPHFTPWCEEARKRGYASSLVLPLLDGEQAFGAITIYSTQPDSFNADDISLLSELANDLAFGITALRLRDINAKAEQAMLESEKRYHSLFDSMTEGFAYCRMLFEDGTPRDFIYLDVNKAFSAQTGLQDVVGRRVTEVIPGIREADPKLFEIYGRVALTGQPEHFEMFVEALRMWFSISVYSPAPEHFVAVFDVITERKEAEETIRSLARFPAENPNPVLRIDKKGFLLYANDAAFAMSTECRLEVGKPAPFLIDTIYEVFARQKTKTVELQCGERIFSFVIASAPGDEYVNLYGSDITERKHAEEALQRAKEEWERTFDSVPDLVMILDTKHRIVRANKAMAARLGRTAEECVGLRCYEYVHGTSAPPAFCPHFSTLANGCEHCAELHEDRLDGDFLVTTTPLNDAEGRLIGSVHVARDITERKQAEEALRKYTEELTLSNQELEQFAYVASHDLQEPLRAVSGYVTLIKNRLGNTLDERTLQQIDGAVEGAARMQRLITDLLALSRVGTRSKPYARTDMNIVLYQVLQSLRVSIEEIGAKITHDLLPIISADAGQMTQLFQNLIVNAIKFHGNRPPEIDIHVCRQDDKWLFQVHDNGIGIEPQYYQRIFQVFQRLYTRKRYPGTGIGLAICKKIVERHGGAIWVESEPGCGTTFYFTIPARRIGHGGDD